MSGAKNFNTNYTPVNILSYEMKDGWIKLFYQFKDWEWYSDTNMVRLFIHLLLSANFKPQKWQGIEIPRGSLVTTRVKLANQTNLSEREIRTCLNRMISTNEITSRTTNKFTIITIAKYESYQSDAEDCDQQNIRSNDQETTKKRPRNDLNKRKKERINNISSCREEIEVGQANLPVDADASTASKQPKLERSISIPFNRIKGDWNATCTAYPRLHVLSGARKTKIRNRIAEMGGLEDALPMIHLLFEKMMQSKFLRGDNKRGWKASFDWLFENDKNWVKVYEGNYDITPENTQIKLNDKTPYVTTTATRQYTPPQRYEQFAQHIITKLTTPDNPAPDISGNY